MALLMSSWGVSLSQEALFVPPFPAPANCGLGFASFSQSSASSDEDKQGDACQGLRALVESKSSEGGF